MGHHCALQVEFAVNDGSDPEYCWTLPCSYEFGGINSPIRRAYAPSSTLSSPRKHIYTHATVHVLVHLCRPTNSLHTFTKWFTAITMVDVRTVHGGKLYSGEVCLNR